MNNTPKNNQNNPSGFKVRRSSMTRREAERHVMSSEHRAPARERLTAEDPAKRGDVPLNHKRPDPRHSNRTPTSELPLPNRTSATVSRTPSAPPPHTEASSTPRHTAPTHPTRQHSRPTSDSSTVERGSASASPPSTEPKASSRRTPSSQEPRANAPHPPSKPPRKAAKKQTPPPPSPTAGNEVPPPSKPKRRSFIQRMEEAEAKKPQRRAKNDFIKPTDVVRIKGSYDRLFLILVIVLTLFGIIMDFSASYAYAYNRYGDSFYFVKRQILWAGVGMIGLLLAMHFDYRWLRKITVPTFIGVLLLLVLVLVYGVASGVAQRWIQVGPVTIQPSELMKFALVFMLALYVARNQDRITNYRNFRQSSIYGMFIPAMIVGVACLLIALEKHFSGTIIVFMIGMVIIFAAGARKFWFFLAGGGALTLIAIAITFVPYARERIDMLLNPENYSPTGKIWQTLQGLYAVGSGGIFGVGLGNSRQKHLYVSQPQNDFIFSIICEELGFAGALLLIVLFMLLIWRGFVIALKAPDTFSSLVVIGLISKVAIQTLLNIAVVTNLIPNTGISLPFFSYGGTALVTQLAEMGIILSISRYSYQRNDL